MSKFTLYNSTILMKNGRFLNPAIQLRKNTVRVRTSDGNVPRKEASTTYKTATLVPGTTDIYDVYKSGTNFNQLLFGSENVVEILGVNTTGITSMIYMFYKCRSLTSVPLFDTSSVTDMQYMFYGCTSLTSIPLFDTSSVTNMNSMFLNCTSLTSVPLFDTYRVTNMKAMFCNCHKVESGALALYHQASSQRNPPSNHYQTFASCGRDTHTGAAELAQIPSDWK